MIKIQKQKEFLSSVIRPVSKKEFAMYENTIASNKKPQSTDTKTTIKVNTSALTGNTRDEVKYFIVDKKNADRQLL